MALGKAAVYKHIPVYYPKNVGAVGGLVGMIGGLGGFVLPIAFGAAQRSHRHLDELLHAAVRPGLRRARVDAPGDPPDGARRGRRGARQASANCRRCRRSTSPSTSARFPARCFRIGARRTRTSGIPPGGRSRGAISGSPSRRCCCPSRCGRSGRWWSPSCRRSVSTSATDQLFWLAALPGISGAVLRIFYSFMVPIFGGRLWTTVATWSLMIPAVGIGYAVQNPSTPVHRVPDPGAAVRPRRRQLRLVDGEYLLLLPEGGEGQRAGAQRRPRQSRRQRRAVRGSASRSPSACSAGSAASR